MLERGAPYYFLKSTREIVFKNSERLKMSSSDEESACSYWFCFAMKCLAFLSLTWAVLQISINWDEETIRIPLIGTFPLYLSTTVNIKGREQKWVELAGRKIFY